jgi:hypothetical protein
MANLLVPMEAECIKQQRSFLCISVLSSIHTHIRLQERIVVSKTPSVTIHHASLRGTMAK